MRAKFVNNSLNEMHNMLHFILTAGAAFFFLKFINGLKKERSKKREEILNLSPEELENRKQLLISKINYIELKRLANYVNYFVENGGKIIFKEDILYYNFILNDFTIKINKQNKTIKWNNFIHKLFKGGYKLVDRITTSEDGEFVKDTFIRPIPLSDEEIRGLVKSIKRGYKF